MKKLFLFIVIFILSLSISVNVSAGSNTIKKNYTQNYSWSDFDYSWDGTNRNPTIKVGSGYVCRRYIFCPGGGWTSSPTYPYVQFEIVFKESEAITLSLWDKDESKYFEHKFPPYGTYEFRSANTSSTISSACAVGGTEYYYSVFYENNKLSFFNFFFYSFFC